MDKENYTKGKGKARETESTSDDSSVTKPEHNDLASRISASAAGLASNLLNSSSATNTFSLASGHGEAGKSLPLAANGPLEDALWTEYTGKAGTRAIPLRVSNDAAEFRSSSSNDDALEDEWSKFLDSQPVLDEKLSASLPVATSTADDVEYQFVKAAGTFDTTEWSSSDIQSDRTVRDGQEVVSLLSDPRFQPLYDDPSLETFMEDHRSLDPDEVGKPFSHNFTAVQLREIRSLLPPLPTYGELVTASPLMLLPDTRARESDPEATSSGLRIQNDEPFDLQQYHGYRKPEEQNHWLEQWQGVLTRYTDEVWGDLLPLVQEAKLEVQKLKQSGKGASSAIALRRLGMILSHMDGMGSS